MPFFLKQEDEGLGITFVEGNTESGDEIQTVSEEHTGKVCNKHFIDAKKENNKLFLFLNAEGLNDTRKQTFSCESVLGFTVVNYMNDLHKTGFVHTVVCFFIYIDQIQSLLLVL